MPRNVWNLMYTLGTTARITGDSANPQTRRNALEGAAVIERNGWRVWVEHHTTGKRIYESVAEKAHHERLNNERIIRFAQEHVPAARGTAER